MPRSGLKKVIVLACAGYFIFRRGSLKWIHSRSHFCSKLLQADLQKRDGHPATTRTRFLSLVESQAASKVDFMDDAKLCPVN